MTKYIVRGTATYTFAIEVQADDHEHARRIIEQTERPAHELQTAFGLNHTDMSGPNSIEVRTVEDGVLYPVGPRSERYKLIPREDDSTTQ